MFGFEAGQYETLPDFGQIEAYRGVAEPANLKAVRDLAVRQGMDADWRAYVAATGELALIAYREEVETVLRTPEMSGVMLLGLQDFPGQGTALVGMMDAHMNPKPFDFARPERFRAFFAGRLPLALMDRYTWEAGETFHADIAVANYGACDMRGPLRWCLSSAGFTAEGELPDRVYTTGGLVPAGTINVTLAGIDRPVKLELALSVDGAENRYPVWVYPPVIPACPEGVHVCRRLDGAALSILKSGGRVFICPPADETALPGSVETHFTTDMWSVGTFPVQSGAMGQLIDANHPIFRDFPTEFHTNWQWWPMAEARAVIVPRGLRPIVRELDSCFSLRHMAQLFECNVGEGRAVFCAMGLLERQQYPEARALLNAIYRYMASKTFAPAQALTPGALEAVINGRGGELNE